MDYSKRKTVCEKLSKFDVLAKDSDFIQVTEWSNGEGNDICINDNKMFNLTWGELDAINYLVKSLDYDFPKDKN